MFSCGLNTSCTYVHIYNTLFMLSPWLKQQGIPHRAIGYWYIISLTVITGIPLLTKINEVIYYYTVATLPSQVEDKSLKDSMIQ